MVPVERVSLLDGVPVAVVSYLTGIVCSAGRKDEPPRSQNKEKVSVLAQPEKTNRPIRPFPCPRILGRGTSQTIPVHSHMEESDSCRNRNGNDRCSKLRLLFQHLPSQLPEPDP